MNSSKPDAVTATGSHPSIQFKRMPMAPGPLNEFNRVRGQVLEDVVSRTMTELSEGSHSSMELLLGEALYLERIRTKRERTNLFTRRRIQNDRRLIQSLQSRHVLPAGMCDRQELMKQLVSHYAEEIGGHFDPRVYRFATSVLPFLFGWLLNAASVQRFVPWGLTESLQSRLTVVGEIDALQKLSKKGTILLVPTHQSNIDSVLVGYIIYLMGLPPFAYGAGLNLFSNPILSFFMSNLGAYTVDRKKNNAAYKATLKNYSSRILQEGVHSIFFPGGGRSRSGAIESKVKLGLLGTALDAQVLNLRENKVNPNIYVVPMTTSYHFVLEASSLVEDFLSEAGRHRYIITDDESWQAQRIFHFFWKLFSSTSGVTVRIGKPLDVFGNFVDPESGLSTGPNGTTIDSRRWLTTAGELRSEKLRDQEYTRELGSRLVERFHRENTVLSSHLVAFSFFETLRKQYPELDLYRFLRVSLPQRTLDYEEFLKSAKIYQDRIQEQARQGNLYLAESCKTLDTRSWVEKGIKNLGLFHEAAVLKVKQGTIFTEDMNLLYYYRNRLAGYGLSLLASETQGMPGNYDRKGFLA